MCMFRHAGELEAAKLLAFGEDADLSRHRKAAMQRVLTQQRATQEKAKEEHRQHLEKRMNAILSLRKNIAASEVCVCGWGGMRGCGGVCLGYNERRKD